MGEPKRIIKLCDNANCPTLELHEEGIVIKDDFNGQVFLTVEQWRDLVQHIERKEFAEWHPATPSEL